MKDLPFMLTAGAYFTFFVRGKERVIGMVSVWLLLLAIVCTAGCASLDERYKTADTRHPCGNVMDICPGDYYLVDKLRNILGGVN